MNTTKLELQVTRKGVICNSMVSTDGIESMRYVGDIG